MKYFVETNTGKTFLEASDFNQFNQMIEVFQKRFEINRCVNLTEMGYVPEPLQKEYNGAGFEGKIKWEDVNILILPILLDRIILKW